MNHEDETNIEAEGDDEMYGLMHNMLGSISNDRVSTETLPEYNTDPMSATDDENIKTLSTLFSEGRRNLFPGCTNIPGFTYDAKKVLKDLGLGALHRYKTYVKNKARSKGSIAEAYIVNESLTFCSMYLHSIETQFNRIHRNDDGGL
ncbi:hypothetical protein JRO89_XS01G0110900 [Xanthoceras sorbifolium]|uniref:DUF4218 domain-containing protein n=1 Tax=Xanthoceras sorbifolium TaxID=99658 RepID=A0ABQ8IJ10_9ROSI|nr:hypothetical protein JRO89_XS01G0110900 [Xanthoceras sorbifolium]